MAVLLLYIVVSSVLFCCISALGAILCLDDASQRETNGHLDVALSLIQVFYTVYSCFHKTAK